MQRILRQSGVRSPWLPANVALAQQTPSRAMLVIASQRIPAGAYVRLSYPIRANNPVRTRSLYTYAQFALYQQQTVTWIRAIRVAPDVPERVPTAMYTHTRNTHVRAHMWFATVSRAEPGVSARSVPLRVDTTAHVPARAVSWFSARIYADDAPPDEYVVGRILQLRSDYYATAIVKQFVRVHDEQYRVAAIMQQRSDHYNRAIVHLFARTYDAQYYVKKILQHAEMYVPNSLVTYVTAIREANDSARQATLFVSITQHVPSHARIWQPRIFGDDTLSAVFARKIHTFRADLPLEMYQARTYDNSVRNVDPYYVPTRSISIGDYTRVTILLTDVAKTTVTIGDRL